MCVLDPPSPNTRVFEVFDEVPFCIKVKKLLHSLGQTKFSAQACLHIMRGKHENQVCE